MHSPSGGYQPRRAGYVTQNDSKLNHAKKPQSFLITHFMGNLSLRRFRQVNTEDCFYVIGDCQVAWTKPFVRACLGLTSV